MAKKTIERRKVAREQAAAAIAVEQEKSNSANTDDYDDEEIIDPDDDDYVPKPKPVPQTTMESKSPAVSFHDTTKEAEEENNQPKSFAQKVAAATFNQGKTYTFYMYVVCAIH
jgi:hypothetical protein